MNDKIRSILPVSASRAERVVDSTAGDMLAEIAVCLIRYVKNPDLCPTELLPWLAWEMSVDTWNEHWTEAEKRAAIKRAAYIHRHRGTKAALNESLADSPFRSQIVEWYEQTPPGEPYTFRLNVEQKDLPVLMSDHQDLKHAVLRAKNLRSWFSIHVYGNCRGNGYGYGYVTATEKLKNKIMPSQILLLPDSVQLALGETASVQVTILPLIAEERSFTVHLADERVADIQVDGDVITLTARQCGATTVSVMTSNGVAATLAVKVVAVARVVVRIDSVSRPLFLIDDSRDTDFTIDYGDGVAGRDYTISGNSVMATRPLTSGEEVTLTVRNCESLMFYRSTSPVTCSLLEIIEISGTRTSMEGFANTQNALRKIHAGAFDTLEKVTTFARAFRGCTALTDLPENLFAGCPSVTSFYAVFYGCIRLTVVPEGMFLSAHMATNFSQLFYGCAALTEVPAGLLEPAENLESLTSAFYGCKRLAVAPRIPTRRITSLSEAFYNCQSLSELPELLPGEGENRLQVTFNRTFESCSGLTLLPAGYFDGIKNRIGNLSMTFRGCTGLQYIPDRLLAGLPECKVIDRCFENCTSLVSVGEAVFMNARNLTSCMTVFCGCTNLVKAGKNLLADAVRLEQCNYLFDGCLSLESIGGGMLSGCRSLKAMVGTFRGCRALRRLPDDMLAGCNSLTRTWMLFASCASLEEIQEVLFAGIRINDPEKMFQGCVALRRIPTGLIAPQTSAISLMATFTGCNSLEMDINDIFTEKFPAGCNLSALFKNCHRVTGSRSTFMAKFPSPASVAETFYDCPQLTD